MVSLHQAADRNLLEGQMPELKFDGGVSLGNVVSWAVMLVGLSVSWGIFSARMDQSSEDIMKLQAEISTARTAISRLEISDARNGERYDSLSRSIAKVENELREANGLLRQITPARQP